jgi:hypothetical protein
MWNSSIKITFNLELPHNNKQYVCIVFVYIALHLYCIQIYNVYKYTMYTNIQCIQIVYIICVYFIICILYIDFYVYNSS